MWLFTTGRWAEDTITDEGMLGAAVRCDPRETQQYHTSALVGVRWKCCSNSKDHPGCKTGVPKHHPGRFVPVADYDCWDGCRGCVCCTPAKWSCCGGNRITDGCRERWLFRWPRSQCPLAERWMMQPLALDNNSWQPYRLHCDFARHGAHYFPINMNEAYFAHLCTTSLPSLERRYSVRILITSARAWQDEDEAFHHRANSPRVKPSCQPFPSLSVVMNRFSRPARLSMLRHVVHLYITVLCQRHSYFLARCIHESVSHCTGEEKGDRTRNWKCWQQ